VSSGSFTGKNAAGGNDYDIDGHVWATGDALQFGPQSIYGLQCLPGAGGSVDNSVLIDLDLNLTMAEKSQIGDVELPCLPCTPPPQDMVAWWPMDEPFGFTAEEIVAGLDAAHVNGVAPIQGKASRALRFDGVNDSATVADHGALDFGAVTTGMPGSGDLSIDAWVRTCVETGVQPIVDKRAVSPVTGYAFYIQSGALSLQLADGTTTDYVSVSSIADGNWHHVAVTVDRDNSNGITFYVDGQPVAGAFDPTSHSGSLANSAALRIGQSHPIPMVTHLEGAIDELEIFGRVLSPWEVESLYSAQNAGKCKDKCHVPWGKPFCQGESSRSVSMTVCNYTPSDHTYSWSLVPVPGAGGTPGVGCNVNGPPSFSPNAGNVFVATGQCVSIPVTVTRPAGFVGTAPLTACFDFLAANLDTGHTFSCRGSVQQSDKYCPVILNPGPILATPVHTANPIVLEIENVTGPGDTHEFSVVALVADGSGEGSGTVSLDGLPPGKPVVRTIKIPPGETQQAEVTVDVLKHDAFTFHDLLVMMDQDGDGNDEVVESIGLRSTFVDGACCLGDATCIGDETPDSCAAKNGSFMGDQVACADVDCQAAGIPAVSEWGMIVMTLCLITTGTVLYRRLPMLTPPVDP